jgi:hypothetical protein
MSLEQEVRGIIADAVHKAKHSVNPSGQLGTLRSESPQEQIDQLTVVVGGLIEAIERVATEVDKAKSP